MRVHSLENHDSPSLLAFLFNFNMDVIHVCIHVAHCTPSPPRAKYLNQERRSKIKKLYWYKKLSPKAWLEVLWMKTYFSSVALHATAFVALPKPQLFLSLSLSVCLLCVWFSPTSPLYFHKFSSSCDICISNWSISCSIFSS